MTLRFPVPARFRAEGLKVFEHFQPLMPARQAIALRRPRTTIAVSLIIAAVGASAFAWGLWRAKFGGGHEIAPVIAAVVGGIGGAAAILIALLTYVLSRRRA